MRLRSEPTVINVALPQRRVVRGRPVIAGDPDVVVVPRRVLGAERHRHPARRPPVLRLPIAVLHAASWAATDRAAENRVAAAVQQRLVTVEQLAGVLAGLPRLRRRALVGAVLLDVAEGAHAQSELDFLRLLARNGLPRPDRLQRPARASGKRYLDAWWERQRLAVEVDGAHHVEVGEWDADTLRANAVVLSERASGLLLLRYTTGNLRHDEAEVVRQLRGVLRA
jgi:very-short-patch-repair endonuclease